MSYIGSEPIGRLVVTVPNVDLKTVGVTNLYTVPEGRKFITTDVILELVALNTLITEPEISVVNDAPGLIFGVGGLIGVDFDAVGKGFYFSTFHAINDGIATAAITSEGFTIQLSISIGATATTMNADVHLIGYLL